ncbi:MAG TPA: carbon-nitrogen hydrolase family protein [Candidatus Saccharimonadales bacterium]|nr:carbon-nitrogen hydrolase family protein [Candidatus Saccharimonadales bacterium]
MPTTKKGRLRVAIAQLPISGDVAVNAAKVKAAMREAAKGRARVIQFPEGMLTGYAKNPIQSWGEVNWAAVHAELQAIMALAAELHLWVVLGSAHQLTPPHWPHNSLYIISDEGALVTRYDKRVVSHTEVTQFYTAGSESVIFDIDGYRFGCMICVEINFPELFIEYGKLGVDCLLLSAYPEAPIFQLKARAHAAVHCYWISLSVPTNRAHMMSSALIGPDGEVVNAIEEIEGLAFADLDHSAPQFGVPLTKARPWRASVATDPAYNIGALNDSRSVNRTVY